MPMTAIILAAGEGTRMMVAALAIRAPLSKKQGRPQCGRPRKSGPGECPYVKTDESEILQSDWKAVGIEVTIDQKEYATMLDDYIAGNFQIGFRGWTADYPIMDNFLQPLMYTGVGDNVSHYSSADFDAKLDEARKTVDEGERIQLMHEADAIAAEDMPIIPMLHKTLNKVTSNKFTNIKVNSARIPELQNATPAK